MMQEVKCLVLALSLLAIPGIADEAEVAYEKEWADLERSIESYSKVRDRELMAIERLREIAAVLQDSAYDANVPVSELRRIDRELGEAWREAYTLSQETSGLRTGLYDRMDLLAQIARELDLAEPAAQARTTPEGRWRFEATPEGVTGMLELELVGNQVNGQYQAANGNLVLLRGVYLDGHLKLQRLGSSLEILGDVIGDLDADKGVLSGTWSSRDLGSGRPVQGQWTAWPAEPSPSDPGGRGPRE